MDSLENTRQQIIESLYHDKDINQAIAKMQPIELQSDLRQEMFLVLCEMSEVKMIDLHKNGYLKFFLVRTMLNMIKSDRSTFYNQYRKFSTFLEFNGGNQDEIKDEIEDGSLFEKIHINILESINQLHWYEKELFLEYVNNGRSIIKLSKDTLIPYRSVIKTINKVKHLLKTKLKKNVIT